jgi:hypothetical protein
MPRRSGGGAGVHGGRRRKGAGRPCLRARGIGVVHKQKVKIAGKSCSPRKEASKATKGKDGAVAATFSDSGGLGGAPADRGSGAGCMRCSSA